MSIKCLTVVLDDDGREVCVFLRTPDGHLTGYGAHLRGFLRGYVIAGIPGAADADKIVPSIGWLATLMIAEFSAGFGSIELLPTGTRDVGESYIYFVSARRKATTTNPSLLNLRIEDIHPVKTSNGSTNGSSSTVIYDGLLDEFDPHTVEAEWSHPAYEPEKPKKTRARAKAAKAR